jgi:hypothetical protein
MGIALLCDNIGASCDKRLLLTTNETWRLLDGSFPQEYGWETSRAGSGDFCPSCSAVRRATELAALTRKGGGDAP